MAVDDWPPLAWLARCSRRERRVLVLHGRRIEVGDGFACEAVWPGEFDAGDFDRAAVVAGSGVRVRVGEVVFVPATSTVDRLYSVERPDGPLVSNSLPCLLSAIAGRPLLGYRSYDRDLDSIGQGLDRYRRTIPMTTGPVRLTYFHNLVWGGEGLAERDKPPRPQGLADFHAYRAFVSDTLAGIAANMTHASRRGAFRWLGTLSSGYDSATATTLGAEVGCEQAICFDRSRRGEPDSGAPIARALGLEPFELERATWRRKAVEFDLAPEVPFLAAVPNGEQAPFSAAREHLGGRVLLTGFQGGATWGYRERPPTAQVGRRDTSGVGLTEFRLVAGFIHCPPAFWTSREPEDVLAITRSEEMRPWVIGDSYQAPISRRIVEEAGVPREAFGQRKQAGVGGPLIDDGHFLGPESLADYRPWVRRNAESLGGGELAAILALDALARTAGPASGLAATVARAADAVADRPVTRHARRRAESVEARVRPVGNGVARWLLTFQWALERAAERYPMPAVLG